MERQSNQLNETLQRRLASFRDQLVAPPRPAPPRAAPPQQPAASSSAASASVSISASASTAIVQPQPLRMPSTLPVPQRQTSFPEWSPVLNAVARAPASLQGASVSPISSAQMTYLRTTCLLRLPQKASPPEQESPCVICLENLSVSRPCADLTLVGDARQRSPAHHAAALQTQVPQVMHRDGSAV